MALGGKIGFFSGDPLKLIEDAQILKPYMFPSVPRGKTTLDSEPSIFIFMPCPSIVLNRLYMAAMQAGQAPGVKGSS